MATAGKSFHCAACDRDSLLDAQRRCSACGASYATGSAGAITQADAALAHLRRQSEMIEASTRQWAEYRAAHVKELKASAPVDWSSTSAGAAADPFVESFAAPAPAAAPAPIAAPAPAAGPVSPPAPVAREPLAVVPGPEPYAVPGPATKARAPRERKARGVLTAPALLGVAGASLLIAASIVFVALAWSVFSPVIRGVIVSGVAVLISLVALWLKRLGLTISSGAVGVVAMGFAGTASLAFSRGSGALGGYDGPTALLVACAAGLVLAKLGIQWVGSAAGLAFAASAIGYTIAATGDASAPAQDAGAGGLRGVWAWTVVGTVAASALALSHRFWRFSVAKVAVQWVSVVWLAIVGIGAGVWIWASDAIHLDAAIAVLPFIALAVLARFWPTIATGPAAFLAPLLAASAASTWGATAWQQATAVAVAVAALLALGPWAPTAVRLPLLIGVSPAYLTVAIASATYSVVITVARIIAGTYVPDTNLWAGTAALVAGLSIAQLRLWRLDSEFVRLASVVGSVMVVTGLGITGFGLAEVAGRDYHSWVGLATAVVAVLLLVSRLAWTDKRAQWVASTGAVAFAVVSGGHALWAIAIAEVPLAVSLVLVAAPIAILVWHGRRAPWWGLPAAVILATAVPAVVAARYEAPAQAIVGASVFAGAALMWSWRWIPVKSRAPVLAGLLPVVAITAGLAFRGLWEILSELGTGISAVDPLWTCVAIVGAVGLAGSERWGMTTAVSRGASLMGAGTLAIALAALAIHAEPWLTPAVEGVSTGYVLVAAFLLAASIPLWRMPAGRWTAGVGAVALATLAGLSAVSIVADSGRSLLPLAWAVAALACLAGCAVWWPRVTLAPAALLATAVAGSLASREFGIAAAVALATVVAVAAVWAALRWAPRHAALVAVGAAPAYGIGAASVVLSTLAAGAQALTLGALDLGVLMSWASPVTIAAVGVGLLSVARLAAGPGAWGTRTPNGPTGTARDPARGAYVTAATAAVALVAVLTSFVATSFTDARLPVDERLQQWALPATVTAILASAVVFAAAHAPRFIRVEPEVFASVGRVARAGVVVWLTMVAGAITVGVFVASETLWIPLASVAIVIGVLLAGAVKWPALVAGPVALLSTGLAAAAAPSGSASALPIALATAVGAATMWVFARGARGVRAAVLVGLIPVSLAAAVVTLRVALWTAGDLVRSVFASDAVYPFPDAWLAATVVFAAAGLLAWPAFRRRGGLVAVITLTVVSSVAQAPVASIVLIAAAAAAGLWPRRARGLDAATLVGGLAALAWVWQVSGAVAMLSAMMTAVVAVIARRQANAPKRWAVVVAPAFAALSASALASAAGWPQEIAAALAMAALAATSVAFARVAWDRGTVALPWVIGVATVLLPLLAGSLSGFGTVLVVAGVAWFAGAIAGVRGSRWWAAATLSVGTAALLASADVSVIEAYTAVPAAAALVLGVMWMRSDPDVRSLEALWPGLALALVPSYVALALDPDSLARTIALTLAIVALALIGVRLKWFAPILATAVTAVVVSALQVIVGTNMLLRLISFVIVGSLLLGIASWFEKLKTLR